MKDFRIESLNSVDFVKKFAETFDETFTEEKLIEAAEKFKENFHAYELPKGLALAVEPVNEKSEHSGVKDSYDWKGEIKSDWQKMDEYTGYDSYYLVFPYKGLLVGYYLGEYLDDGFAVE